MFSTEEWWAYLSADAGPPAGSSSLACFVY